MNLLQTLLILLSFYTIGYSQEIRGTFFYTCGTSDSSIVWPALPQEKPAFYIFDIPTQTIKIYNFIETEIFSQLSTTVSCENLNRRAYTVTRRIGTDPVISKIELTDFSLVEWKIDTVYEDESGIGYGGTCTFYADGSWSYNAIPIFGFISGKYGEVISFTEPLTSDALLSVQHDTNSDTIYFKAATKVGLKHKLYESQNLKTWNLAAFEDSNNLLGSGELVGSGYTQILASKRAAGDDMTFYYLESNPIEFTD